MDIGSVPVLRHALQLDTILRDAARQAKGTGADRLLANAPAQPRQRGRRHDHARAVGQDRKQWGVGLAEANDHRTRVRRFDFRDRAQFGPPNRFRRAAVAIQVHLHRRRVQRGAVMEPAIGAERQPQRAALILPGPGGREFGPEREIRRHIQQPVAQRRENHTIDERTGARRVQRIRISPQADTQGLPERRKGQRGSHQEKRRHAHHERPPSTERICPDTQSEAGSAKKSTALEMSSGRPGRRQ